MNLAQRLGKYDLLERLAIGGMGEIFLARQTGAGGFQRLVVVKRLIPELAERRDLVTLFIDEARIAAHLAHPNIVQIHDFGEEAGAFYLAMEYVPGQNLARLVERAEREGIAISRRAAAHVVAEIARGLEFAHAARDEAGTPLAIVHRDVSPHNIMISVGGEVKLTDFGIAKAAIRQQRTETGVVRGKLAYMSPEQVEGAEVDARTDVYAAGIVLWELTLGQRLHGEGNQLATMVRVKEGVIRRPREVDPEYPEALEAIVMAALAREPAERTQTAGELATALKGWLDGEAGEVDELAGVVRRLFPQRGKGVVESALSKAATKAIEATADAGAEGRGVEGEPASGSPSPSVATPIERPVPVAPRRGFGLAVWVMGAAAMIAAGAIWARSRLAQSSASSGAALHDAGTATANGRADLAATAPAGGGSVAPAGGGATTPVDGAVTAVNVAAENAETKEPPPPHRGRGGSYHDGNGTRKRPGQTAGRPPPPVEPPVETPPAPVAPGTLVISAEPDWANVTVDGAGWDSTPVTRPVKPGRYEVKIDVSKGGGSFHTTAVVESGKMTKCRKVGTGPFACDSPQ